MIQRDSRNNLWLAGSNGAIKLSDDATPAWYRHSDKAKSLAHNRIRAMLEDSCKQIWFATDAGINRFNDQTNDFDVFHIVDKNGEHSLNWVYALIEDGDFFCTGSFLSGLHFIDKSVLSTNKRTVVANFSLNAETEIAGKKALANNLVNNVVRDQKVNLWVLLFRENTLTKFNPKVKSLQRFNIYELTTGYPTHITVDKSGRIWCPYKGGLEVFSEDESYRIAKFPHTNSNETTLALGKVDDGVWISTLSNVWSIDGSTLEASLMPIPQKSYSAIYEDTVSQKVYLGGTDEILQVDKSIMEDRTDFQSINMVLNDEGNGRFNLWDIENGRKEQQVPYGGNLTLVISTLNYSPESVHRYMHRLTDSAVDNASKWVVMPEGANTVSFSDLKMGRYTLFIKTVGSPMPPVTTPIKVSPPLFMSWWAICLYLFIVLVTIYWGVWYARKRDLRSLQ